MSETPEERTKRIAYMRYLLLHSQDAFGTRPYDNLIVCWRCPMCQQVCEGPNSHDEMVNWLCGACTRQRDIK